MQKYKDYMVRCYSCSKPINHLASEYEGHIKRGETVGDALDIIGLVRPCCREKMMNPPIVYINPFHYPRNIKPYTFKDVRDDPLPTVPNIPSISDQADTIALSVSFDYGDYYIPKHSGVTFLAE